MGKPPVTIRWTGILAALKEDLNFKCEGKSLDPGCRRSLPGSCHGSRSFRSRSNHIAGRTLQKAQRSLKGFDSIFPLPSPLLSISSIWTPETGSGMRPVGQCDLFGDETWRPMLIDPSWLSAKTHIYDLIYNPWKLPFEGSPKKRMPGSQWADHADWSGSRLFLYLAGHQTAAGYHEKSHPGPFKLRR